MARSKYIYALWGQSGPIALFTVLREAQDYQQSITESEPTWITRMRADGPHSAALWERGTLVIDVPKGDPSR